MPLQSKVPINHSIQVNDLNLLEIVPLELDLMESVVTVFPGYLISKNEKKVANKILNVETYIKILLFKKLERKTKIKKLIKGKKTGSKYILSF